MDNSRIRCVFIISLIVVILFLGQASSECPASVHHDVKGFGRGCKYRCNCANNEQCDNETGECPSGCLQGWMGPGCQYRNFATMSHRNITQHPTPESDEHDAYNALDGNVSTCSMTGRDNQSNQQWWRVEFVEQMYIVGLIVTTLDTYIGTFRSFSVEIGNLTDNPHLCYKHKTVEGWKIINISCVKPIVGNVLKISVDEDVQSTLVICEIEIFGGRLISFHKPTSAESTLNYKGTWDSSYAVDGRPMTSKDENQDIKTERTCAATKQHGKDSKLWWNVKLETSYYIQGISFFGRLDRTDQHNSYTVSVAANESQDFENIFTDRTSGEASSYNPQSFNHTIPFLGDSVRVERNASILVICEFEVFGECPPGQCDWDCSKTCMCSSQTTGIDKLQGKCPYGCSGRCTGQHGKCDIQCSSTEWGPFCNMTCGQCKGNLECIVTDGTCPNSCKPGWKPPLCVDECDNGTYGSNCSEKCGNCVAAETCDHTTGYCSNGCAAGYNGSLCIEACDKGTYGPNCSEQCGHCVAAGTCNHITGHCLNGCEVGYSGNLCTEECDNGTYGYNCSEKCGHCIADGICHHITGNCLNGCEAGYNGSLCIEECNNGMYGLNCSYKCGHCAEAEVCNPITGYCLNGCEAGYTGSICIEECDIGTYGSNCSERCGHCIADETCDHITGYCTNGCEAGYNGSLCIEECDNGTYGSNCSEKCGHCVGDDTCNHINGYCLNGCEPGYNGSICIEKCDIGKYGSNCSEMCGQCIADDTCDHVTGYCLNGCNAGYSGNLCIEVCGSGSYGENCSDRCGSCLEPHHCDTVTGYCKQGCKAGFRGSLCKEVCGNGTFGLGCQLTCGNCAETKQCNHSTGACPLGCSAGYKGDRCMSEDTTDRDTPIASIVGPITGIVIAASLIVVALLVYRRKFRIKTAKNGNSDTDTFLSRLGKPASNSEGISWTGISTRANYSTHFSTQCSDTSIPVSQLRTVCRNAKFDRSDLFSQFESLPYGLQYDASVAKDAKNVSKNRYKDMYPYNKNRVVLPEVEGDFETSYINASYINGYDLTKKYIAAQGALAVTVDDIWRMVWSEEITVIVMLTRCHELGRLKCFQYWSEEEPCYHKNIRTELISVEDYSDFRIRTFNCSEANSENVRTVVQFHYTAWPDKDVPDTALSLVQFWRTIRRHETANKYPWMVHCSAGVGRTGTFIALDFLYEQGRAEGSVDIKRAVLNLREQRLNMVQTKEQYVYLHETVAEILDPIGSVCTTKDFQEECLEKLTDNKLGTNLKALYNEYKKLCQATEKATKSEDDVVYSNITTETFADEKLYENLQRCRNPEIYPADIHRPRLGMEVEGRNDFINAIFISTFRQKDRMILTQVPLEDTVIDFVRMIWEYDLNTIVLLEETVQEEYRYWTAKGKTKTIGPFVAEVILEQAENVYTYRRCQYTLSGQNEQKEVRQFHFSKWPNNDETPLSTESVLQLISDIENKTQTASEHPIVIQCNDGAKKSGLFCVLFSVLERMKSDGEVAVAETARLVRLRRSQAINNLEQYNFCYNAVKNYLEGFDVYANVM